MRPSGMRNRIVALAAVSAFAVGMAGLALVAAGSGGSLQRLPSLSASGERAADMATLGAPAFGGVDYVVEGVLPALPGEAPAYRLGKDDDRDAVERLAEALGVDGPVRKQEGAYSVTGATRTLTVSNGAGSPWYLSTGCPDAPVSSDGASVRAMGCASAAVTSCRPASSDGPDGSRTASALCSVAPDAGGGSQPSEGSTPSGGSPGHVAEPCPPCPPGADCGCGWSSYDPPSPKPPSKVVPPHPEPVPVPPADVPDRAGAERIARDTFGRLGLPLDSLRLEGGEWGWHAMLSPSVDGLPVVGAGHNLSIGPKGELTGGNGFLGSPRRIGDYPLVGVQGGLDRLREGVAVDSGPLYDGREPAIATAPADKHVVTLTGAHLALQQVGEYLVPVYAFELKGGGELPVPAVTDRYLEQVRPDDGPPKPVPGGSGNSGSCSGSASGVGAGDDDGNRNQPLTVDLCVEPDKVKVGQPVTFKVTATDPDASIIDQCGSPTAAFGDGEPAQPDCGIACTLSLPLHPEKAPRTRGELTKSYTHAYAKPGTYTATFGFQSGPCNHWSSQGEATATVVVVG